MQLKIKRGDFYLLFYKIIIFIGIFDGIRTKLVFGGPFTILKEISTIILLIGILYERLKINKKELLITNGPLILYLLFETIVILFNDYDPKFLSINREMAKGFALHFKTIESFFLIFILLKFEELTQKKYSYLLRYFIKYSVWYVIVNYLFYFFLPISIIAKPWYGRISVGYPTADAQILVIALLANLFIKNLFRPTTTKAISTLLIIGIITNVTLSAYLSLVFVLLLYIIQTINTKGIFSFKSIIILSLIAIFSITCIYFYNNAEGNFGQLLRLKIDYGIGKITGNSDKMNSDPSEEIRNYQEKMAFSIKKDALSKTLGGPISVSGLIEDEKNFLYRAYGIVSLFFYYGWIIYLFFNGLFFYIKKQMLFAYLLFGLLGIYIICNQSLANTYMFGISASFALILSSIFKNQLILKKTST